MGAKKAGATNVAAIGAIIGGIVGAIVGAGFFGFGIIAGTFIGIFLGAFFAELIIQRNFIKSLKAGAGSVLGRIGSILVKVLIAVIMFTVMILKITGTSP